MAICEWCGQEFDPAEAADEFEIECGMFSYAQFRKCLCGSCAISAISDHADGVYFETCEECGRTFDLGVDYSRFNSYFPSYNGTTLTDYWDEKILCCDCALEFIGE